MENRVVQHLFHLCRLLDGLKLDETNVFRVEDVAAPHRILCPEFCREFRFRRVWRQVPDVQNFARVLWRQQFLWRLPPPELDGTTAHRRTRLVCRDGAAETREDHKAAVFPVDELGENRVWCVFKSWEGF